MYEKDDEFVFVCNEDHLKNTGIKDVIEQVTAKMKTRYKIVPIPSHKKGPVVSVKYAYDEIEDDEEVIVNYCDFTMLWKYNDFLGFKDIKRPDGIVVSYRGFHPHMLGSDNYAFMKNDETNRVLEIKEKVSFTDNKMSEHASSGIYYFKTGKILKKYFDETIKKNVNVGGEHYVSLVYGLMIQDGLDVFAYEADEMFQWGTPEDMENYQSWSDYFASCDFQSDKYYRDTCHIENGVSLVLPMAGKGSRYRNNGVDIPKPFLHLEGKPMFVEAIKCLPRFEKSVVVCLQEHLDAVNVREIIDKEGIASCEIVSIPGVTEGQACTTERGIIAAKIGCDDPIVVTACDNSSAYDLESYRSLLLNEEIDVIVWSFRGDDASKNNPNMYSWLDVDKDMKFVV